MAFPLAAVLAGAATLGSQGLNYAVQGKMNRSSREFAKEQMWRENEINLENWNKQNQYNEGLWNKQNEYNQMAWNKENEYNSPAAQMERYRRAGLNPHLIYGQSNTGGQISTAQFETQDMKPAAHAEWHPKAPEFDLKDGLMAYFQVAEMQAQTDNLRKLGKVYDADAQLRLEQANNMWVDTQNKYKEGQGKAFDLDLKSELRPQSVDAAHLANEKARLSMTLDSNRDKREQQLNQSNLNEAMERMKTMRGDQLLKSLEAQLKQYEIDLNKAGLRSTDNLIYRQIWLWYQKMGGMAPYGSVGQNLGELLKPEKNGTYKLNK